MGNREWGLMSKSAELNRVWGVVCGRTCGISLSDTLNVSRAFIGRVLHRSNVVQLRPLTGRCCLVAHLMKISPAFAQFYANPQGDAEACRLFHFGFDEACGVGGFSFGTFQNKLIVDLQQ